MCPPTSFSDHGTSASEKIRSTPRKTFFNSIDRKRTFGRVKNSNSTVLNRSQPSDGQHGRFPHDAWGIAMRKLATVIAAIALIGTPAFAADMAVKAPPLATPVAPVINWTGFYVGGNLGGVVEHASGTSDFLDNFVLFGGFPNAEQQFFEHAVFGGRAGRV